MHNKQSAQFASGTIGDIMDTNNVVSLSGGKDSTAMLHWMLERGENIHSVVYFDTGWEFPEMATHIDLVEQKTGIKIIRLQPKEPFEYVMFDRPIKKKSGILKGELHRYGHGWPTTLRRWCTRTKINSIERYKRSVKNCVSCIGIAADEKHREKSERYPLIEFGKTERDCLEYCYSLGYTWGGLYEVFDRVSCWICPLKGINGFRKLRKNRPYLWNKLRVWEMRMRSPAKPLLENLSWFDLEARFRKEEKQGKLF